MMGGSLGRGMMVGRSEVEGVVDGVVGRRVEGCKILVQ
jgi:hypothetical protein